MILYELMNQYAKENRSQTDPDCKNPELGESLSLLHSSLIECDLKNEEQGSTLRLTATPKDIEPIHLSHFIVAYLPSNSITKESETNHVLFDIYSFFNWLDKNKIPHGLTGTRITELFKQLRNKQERCLKLSQLLDNESGKTLKNPPNIQNTLNDVFSVITINSNSVALKGRRQNEIIYLRLPSNVISLIQLNDCLELILGDTSQKWVLLEAGQVYPKIKKI